MGDAQFLFFFFSKLLFDDTFSLSLALIFCHYHVLQALYLLYAKLEEDHGLARHAMAVYDRATKAVLPEEQYEVMLYVEILCKLVYRARN